jgi:hypothetical protein
MAHCKRVKPNSVAKIPADPRYASDFRKEPCVGIEADSPSRARDANRTTGWGLRA